MTTVRLMPVELSERMCRCNPSSAPRARASAAVLWRVPAPAMARRGAAGDGAGEGDAGGAEREHAQVQSVERTEGSRHRRGAVADAGADNGENAAVARDGDVAHLAEVDDERVQVLRVIHGHGHAHLGG